MNLLLSYNLEIGGQNLPRDVPTPAGVWSPGPRVPMDQMAPGVPLYLHSLGQTSPGANS